MHNHDRDDNHDRDPIVKGESRSWLPITAKPQRSSINSVRGASKESRSWWSITIVIGLEQLSFCLFDLLAKISTRNIFSSILLSGILHFCIFVVCKYPGEVNFNLGPFFDHFPIIGPFDQYLTFLWPGHFFGTFGPEIFRSWFPNNIKSSGFVSTWLWLHLTWFSTFYPLDE